MRIIKNGDIGVKIKMERMSYEDFSYIRSLIEADIKSLEIDFRTACNFIPYETPKPKQKSGVEKANEVLSKEVKRRQDALDSLFLTMQQIYKDHPNEEMLKFWEIK